MGSVYCGKSGVRVVINLRRIKRFRADETGRRWSVTNDRDMRLSWKYRCFFNGKEVTHETFYCDTRRGIVRMFVRDAGGKFYIGHDGNIVQVERRGHVKLRRK